jgi:superfamily II DNA/RNA helicase
MTTTNDASSLIPPPEEIANQLAETLENTTLTGTTSTTTNDQSPDTEIADPTLHSGALEVREAGKMYMGECDVKPISSFQALPIPQALKESIASEMGWQSMSKIQQQAIPLILRDPPAHMIGQAQAGTGKTGAFVIGCLSRIDTVKRDSQPQAIILAITVEMVTQIAGVVASLGKGMGISPRRVMGAGVPGGGSGGGRGRGGGGVGGRGRGQNNFNSRTTGNNNDGSIPGNDDDQQQQQQSQQASWVIPPGADYQEQIIVGTPGKVKGMLQDYTRKKKPYIDAREVRVVVLDEADKMIQENVDSLEIRDMIYRQRAGKPVQFLLFSATYTDAMREKAREFVGNNMQYFHEIQLKREDMTLDNVDNFFVFIGEENDSFGKVDELKQNAVVKIWESLASSPLFGQSVIFVNTKARAQQLADFLRSKGYNVGQIHGDMARQERERVFQEFKDNKRPALVATNVLSRGIDNQNVTLVINVDLPLLQGMRGEVVPDPETFVHRIGRSGRWTKRGASVSLISTNPSFPDKNVMKTIEAKYFANELIDRPLIQVSNPSEIGTAFEIRLKERMERKKNGGG